MAVYARMQGGVYERAFAATYPGMRNLVPAVAVIDSVTDSMWRLDDGWDWVGWRVASGGNADAFGISFTFTNIDTVGARCRIER